MKRRQRDQENDTRMTQQRSSTTKLKERGNERLTRMKVNIMDREAELRKNSESTERV
jgi:hypothetical protein